jgi:DNA-binding transcriptional MerR regulator
MDPTITIAELARRTGLTSRTLRFYDARGLVVAHRTPAGGRVYGPAEVARLHQVTALKRAGFALAQIGAMLGGKRLDLARLIDAQLDTLAVERDRIDEATATLRTARQRLDAGRALDIDTFCTLIKQGETAMADEAAWKKVADRYFTPEEQAHWAERKRALIPAGFDGDAYQAQWADLGSRIGAALPMNPASAPAQAFLAEWNALLAPFKLVADARMATQTVALYDRMDEWSGEMSPGFTHPVWEFIKAAAVAKPA